MKIWRAAVLALLAVANAVLFYRMLWGPAGLVEFRGLKARYTMLEEKVVELDAANRALSHEIRLLQSDNAYVEKMIRQRLHYVRDDELLYLFSEPSKGARDDDRKN